MPSRRELIRRRGKKCCVRRDQQTGRFEQSVEVARPLSRDAGQRAKGRGLPVHSSWRSSAFSQMHSCNLLGTAPGSRADGIAIEFKRVVG